MTDYEAMWGELRNWVIIHCGLDGDFEINRIMEKYNAPFDLAVGDFVTPNKDGTVSKWTGNKSKKQR